MYAYTSVLNTEAMPNLYFASTPKTPEIACRGDGFISLKGRSLPEDTASFYAPVIEWLSDYYRDPQPETLVHIDLEYLNSSSASMLHKMCFALERLVKISQPYCKRVILP